MGLPVPERFDADLLQKKLRSKYLGRPLMLVQECRSTNDVAAVKAAEGAPHGFVVIAEKQTVGRGREGRRWFSPEGGIWLTAIVRPQNHQDLGTLPLVCALAICNAINREFKLDSRVRWPNDVMLNDRKLGGVIAESKVKGTKFMYVLLGVGLNANFETDRISAIRGTAVSLFDVLRTPICREALVGSILNETEKLYDLLNSIKGKRILAMLRKIDWSRGKNVRIKLGDRELVGVVDGYDTLSKMRILTAQGLETLDTSDVVSVEYESN
jgi:BirA family biotin operon repressor/biotin-[acetyl-CoA-carboxylase] ligase